MANYRIFKSPEYLTDIYFDYMMRLQFKQIYDAEDLDEADQYNKICKGTVFSIIYRTYGVMDLLERLNDLYNGRNNRFTIKDKEIPLIKTDEELDREFEESLKKI